jgi:hypothetical protein
LCTQRRLALEAECPLEAARKLRRGPNVVGQDEDVLGLEGAILVQQPADPLDDDGRLPGAGTRENHQRPVAPLDGGALLRR